MTALLPLAGVRKVILEVDHGVWFCTLWYGDTPPVSGHGATPELALAHTRVLYEARVPSQ